jgi:hypothetical protein
MPGRGGGHQWPRCIMRRPSSTSGSVAVDGPLLAGIKVTVFPGGSSRPLTGSGAAIAGRSEGWIATAGRSGWGSIVADLLADTWRRGARARFTRGCGRSNSTGEAISTFGTGAASVRSRLRAVAVSSCACLPHPEAAATTIVRESRKRVRMTSPAVLESYAGCCQTNVVHPIELVNCQLSLVTI